MNHSEVLFNQIIKKGESAIDGFIDDRESESLFLDFKRATNNGAGKKLDPHDRKNLAKAISGFGNSEGGLIVWGVDCREGDDYADVARAKFPIEDAKKFESWLEGAISSCTIPPHPTVKHHTILKKDNKTGYVITFIPKSKIEPKSLGHWVTFTVDNIGRFKQLEYEFEYTTGSMIQGGLGRIDFTKERPPVSKEIAFGSESKGKYKYDEGVYTGQFTFTFSNGEDAALRTDFNLQNAGENNGIFTTPDNKAELRTGKELKSGDYLIIASTLGLPGPVNGKVIAGPYGFYADSSRSLTNSTLIFNGAEENAKILFWDGKKWQELTTQALNEGVSAQINNLGTFVLIEE